MTARRTAILSAPRPRPPKPSLARRFTVWCGVRINPVHRTMEDLAVATYSLLPTGEWQNAEVELLLKAGEGGSWQSTWDNHPLAISGPPKLEALVDQARDYTLRITPYVVVRGRPSWVEGEQAMIAECVRVAGRCVLNVEPGSDYWNGPNDPTYIRSYLRGIGVPAGALEVCTIPRAGQVAELGGVECLQAWTDPSLVSAASWEVYDGVAPGTSPNSLQPDVAIPRLDGWGVPPGSQYRVCCVQRNRIDAWESTPWCMQGMAVWHLDGDI